MTAKKRPASSARPDARLAALWPVVAVVAELFRNVPDTAFFVKDCEGRYALCNQSLAERCGFNSPDDLVGRRVRDLFPAELGERYATQDEQIIRTGRPVVDRLELHWYSRRRTGWCLTTKLPLRDAAGNIVGLIGLSRDLRALKDSGQIPAGLLAAMEHLESNFHEPLSATTLAKKAGLAPVRFARLIKRIFRLTPSQLIAQRRLAAASRLLLETKRSVADIALACGFYDHSAFTRAFRAATGGTPTEFRGEGKFQNSNSNF